MGGRKDGLLSLIINRLGEVVHRRNPYLGTTADLNLVAESIYSSDSGQNIEAIPSDDSSEGLPEEALQRLISYYGKPRTVRLLVNKYGAPGSEPDLLKLSTEDGIQQLQNSPRYSGNKK